MLELAKIFSRGMILQREKEIAVWGRTDSSAGVSERKPIGFVVVSDGFLRAADGKIMYTDRNTMEIPLRMYRYVY